MVHAFLVTLATVTMAAQREITALQDNIAVTVTLRARSLVMLSMFAR